MLLHIIIQPNHPMGWEIRLEMILSTQYPLKEHKVQYIRPKKIFIAGGEGKIIVKLIQSGDEFEKGFKSRSRAFSKQTRPLVEKHSQFIYYIYIISIYSLYYIFCLFLNVKLYNVRITNAHYMKK